MSKTDRTYKELLDLINELQSLQHNKNETPKKMVRKPQSSQNHYEIKKNNVLQKRKTTKSMADANTNYIKGDENSFEAILQCMKTLVDFYPKHIEKEDNHFFLPVMEYFSAEEKETMLEEGYLFDQKLIHDKYKNMVLQTEALFK